jgi:DNA repair protein RecN (Recombination protein N)
MLCELSIKNFAIIEDLRIAFSEGLTILSGETGAGKSIIINAVNLILGSRAAAELIRTACEEAEVEAYFTVPMESKTDSAMRENGIEPEDGLLIRRVISHAGRHKIYINGRMATIQMLAAVTENLAGISGQHAHQGLLREDFHLMAVDQFGGLLSLRRKISEDFHRLLPLIEKLENLFAFQKNQTREIELLEFQKKEIADAEIEAGEDESLEKERHLLRNAQTLYQAVQNCRDLLYDAQGSVIEHLAEAKKTLEKASGIDPELNGPKTGVDEALYRIEDISAALMAYLKKIQMDEGRLDQVESRLDLLARVKRKYGGSLERVLERFRDITDQLAAIENIAERIETHRLDIKRVRENLLLDAEALSEKRVETAKALGRQVERELSELNMANTKFSVKVRPLPVSDKTSPYLVKDGKALCESGFDSARFMIAPNPGEELKPLTGIASGGELSRVVLALKAISADLESVGTVVFDEVDAGIGGETAEVVGRKLSALARRHQVLCITHLPQIAKFADHHYRISKKVDEGRTVVLIDPIENEERVKEIARMIGGASITRTTLDHAREMLSGKMP